MRWSPRCAAAPIRSPRGPATGCRSCSAPASPPASAPLLFVQLLYQRRFYTANLLMGPRWGAVVPALIVGFYALYLAKASERVAPARARRRRRLCFAFVAWSWTELHQVMLDDPGVARDVRRRRAVLPRRSRSLPRLAIWLGAMLALFATVAAWPAAAAERRRLAAPRASPGLVACGVTAAAAIVASGDFDPAHGWTYLLVLAALAAALGWGWTARRPDGPRPRARHRGHRRRAVRRRGRPRGAAAGADRARRAPRQPTPAASSCSRSRW